MTGPCAGQLRNHGSVPGKQYDILLFARVSRLALVLTQRPAHQVTGALLLRLQWLGRKADHSSLSSAEVEILWSYTSILQYAFMMLCLIKHKNSFMTGAGYYSRLPSGRVLGQESSV